ncbi:hypothetical protein Tco_0860182 [Tanacetum coccineum]|uniref:Uncharacterized protein n=1 Tax=Tanacetum coccineum TaxID=301880 RepID=A0ABQ5BE59_9ASTR
MLTVPEINEVQDQGYIGGRYFGSHIVMSDSKDSTVTYTTASPSPDYVPGPEDPEQAPLSLEFVPEPVYPEFMPPEDDVLTAEEQPLPATVSPTADSLGYILESDPEEDPEEDDDEDPEEDPANYPTDRDDDKEEEEPSRDKADNEDEEEDDKEEDKEHPTLADSVLPPPVHRTTARISIPTQAHVPFLFEEEVERFLAIPTSPPSLLTPLSSPLPQIPSPPLPVSPPLHVSSPPPPANLTYPLGFRAAMIQLRAKTPSTSHLLPSTDRPEVCLPPQKRLCIALCSRYKVGESSSAPTARPTRGFREDYGFVATLDDEIRRDPERDDTDEIYGRLEEAQDAKAVLSGQLNLLQKDRRSHAYTALLMEREARLSREAWGWSMDASDTTRFEIRSLWTIVLAHQAEIGAL